MKRWITPCLALMTSIYVQAALIEVKLDNPRSANAATNVKITGSDQMGVGAASVVFTDPSGGTGTVAAIRTKAYTT